MLRRDTSRSAAAGLTVPLLHVFDQRQHGTGRRGRARTVDRGERRRLVPQRRFHTPRGGANQVCLMLGTGRGRVCGVIGGGGWGSGMLC